MKKFLAMALSLALAFTAAGCGKSDDEADKNNVTNAPENTTPTPTPTTGATPTDEPTPAPTEGADNTPDQNAEGVMTYAEYAAAALESEVTIEAYVQAKQSWWENQATVYAQDEDGAYFLYNMACSAEDYEKLTTGTKIRVKGFKTEWSGEFEIIDATFEIIDGNYVAQATDVTSLLSSEDLIQYQNQFVSFRGMTVEEKKDPNGLPVAFLYNWDGSGTQEGNSDLYFDVSKDGQTYTFTVESYLCDNTTDVYKTVEALAVGDVIDMEGFLYWYNGVNPHITSVTVVSSGNGGNSDDHAAAQKSEGVMTYAEYDAAALDSPVTIEAYVQAKQSWWENQATVYAQDEDGAYFLYNMACSAEDYEKLTPGTKIRVNGYKAEWSGEVEIIDSTFEIIDGSYIAPATDVTTLLGLDDLVKYQNQFVSFQGMTVEPSTDPSGNEVAFLYNWDGSGTQEGNSDLYFNVSKDGQTYTFTVESYLCDNTTDVYKAVEALKVGDVIDMEGFLYWYNGVNPHITSVTTK